MSMKSRTFWSTVTVILATIMAIATMSAQGPGGRPQRGGGPGREFGPGPLLRQLDLTEAQRQQVQALVQERRADDGARKLGDLHHDLNTAVFADTPDTTKIEQLKASILEAEAAALAERIDLQLKIAQILTPEQRQKARELPPGPGRGRSGFHH